ncbi:MAG: tetratricopeptide repeat protein [Bacteroidaceae bacterium]|nr:tetratricopeptide repeat protein [Bacteroidaceae bacterium]
MKHYLILLLLLASCSNETIIRKMEQIKTFGNENPREALAMLDSLDVSSESEYIKNKYSLLRIRLSDKSNIMPSSDEEIKRLVGYFEAKGTAAERQEVYYYAGSTYRDLQDTPRALENFFKSLDLALEHKECDPIMLRNTYSNLSYLFYMVKDYPDALEYGKKELECCRQTKTDVVVPFIHIGAPYLDMDSLRQAEAASDSAFAHIMQSGNFHKYQESLALLLYYYSYIDKVEKAKKCLPLIEGNTLEDGNYLTCMTFAFYYEALGKNDSAAIYCKKVLDDAKDTLYMYDAAKHLFTYYNELGDEHNAARFAKAYMDMSSAMDFGRRQELSATVNNQYKYRLDQKEEQRLKDERERYRRILLLLAPCALLLISVGYILYIRRRNKHLQDVVALSSELKRLSEEEDRLREMVREKQEQNKTILQFLHQSELEGKAEDVIQAVRQSSTGKRDMTSADWKQLYQAVDELYPSFRDRLLRELGTFTEQQMQVCYLMRIGLTKPQIQNMTNLSRTTVWRWVNRYEWADKAEDK